MIEALIAVIPFLLKLNVILSITAVVILALTKLNLSSAAKQLLVRLALVSAIVAPLTSHVASQIFQPANIFEPPVQIAAAGGEQAAPAITTVINKIQTSTGAARATQALTFSALALLFLTLSTAVLRLAVLLRDRSRLQKISNSAITLRHIHNVKVQLSKTAQTPFAARLQRKALIMIPESYIWKPDALGIAIRHELQHHRQNDLRWNNLLEATRFIAGWNPLVHLALKRIEEIDELACDENLLGRGQIDVKRYATCLFQAALALNTDETKLAGTARMATSKTFLRRRIEMTLARQRTNNKFKAVASAILIIVTTATAAWASEGLIKDRRISHTQAEALAHKINVPMNKRVLKFLNLATGTPRNRFYMRNALKRMKQYQPMIEAKLEAANLSKDLLAVPIVESGYQNTETTTSAGLWQFIPWTARKYGLKVSDAIDERLDANKESDAAVAYISHLQTLFQNDLMLSLLSYNAGESQVAKWISSGERDVFKLADDGVIDSNENANYNAKYISALIIMNNPSLVNE